MTYVKPELLPAGKASQQIQTKLNPPSDDNIQDSQTVMSTALEAE